MVENGKIASRRTAFKLASELCELAPRQCQAHGRSVGAALSLDPAAELPRQGLHQPAAGAGIRAPGVGSLAIIGDRQAKFSRTALKRHHD
jgi:hypothetical protein